MGGDGKRGRNADRDVFVGGLALLVLHFPLAAATAAAGCEAAPALRFAAVACGMLAMAGGLFISSRYRLRSGGISLPRLVSGAVLFLGTFAAFDASGLPDLGACAPAAGIPVEVG